MMFTPIDISLPAPTCAPSMMPGRPQSPHPVSGCHPPAELHRLQVGGIVARRAGRAEHGHLELPAVGVKTLNAYRNSRRTRERIFRSPRVAPSAASLSAVCLISSTSVECCSPTGEGVPGTEGA